MMRRGFTLIELLVVISILTLLVGLLVPVMNNVRQQARSVACQSNIHQLQVSLHAYETENHSLPYGFDPIRTSPPYSGSGGHHYPGTLTMDLPGWWWFNYARIDVQSGDRKKEDGMPTCPSKQLEDPRLDWDTLCGNYGVNRALCTSSDELKPFGPAYERPPASTSDLRHPGSTLLVLDSGYALICWWQATGKPPVTLGNLIADTSYVPGLDINKDRLLRPGQVTDAVGGRHPKKTVNVGFADGHCDRKKALDLLVEKTGDDTYANKTPLWEPR
jgi:prepilin-type N-terminal cleavage/methylation domain-containing protein/prepilin-type processing-associated H-X9-DG protein